MRPFSPHFSFIVPKIEPNLFSNNTSNVSAMPLGTVSIVIATAMPLVVKSCIHFCFILKSCNDRTLRTKLNIVDQC